MNEQALRKAIMASVLADDADAHDERAPLPEAQVDELRGILTTYQAGCSFAPGDIITPRRGRNIVGAGMPCIVLEVFAEPLRGRGSTGSTHFGARCDMRIARWVGDDYCAFMAESWQYERWENNDD